MSGRSRITGHAGVVPAWSLLAFAALVSGCGSDTALEPPSDDGGPGSGGAAASTGGRTSTGGTGSGAAGDAGALVPDAAPPGTGGAAGSGGTTASGGTSSGGIDGGHAPDPDGGPEPIACDGPGARFITSVVAHEFGPGQAIGQDRFPGWIFGPPRGTGDTGGATTHIVSLGNGGTVTVAFEGNGIVDGPGVDFIVFENAFFAGGDPEAPFAELATVAVSDDGVTWHEYPCTATADPPYGSCAGWHPVYANADENDLDPLDPETAGGDGFDLADVGVQRARYVRITDRPDLTGLSGVFDLDAIAIVNPACP